MIVKICVLRQFEVSGYKYPTCSSRYNTDNLLYGICKDNRTRCHYFKSFNVADPTDTIILPEGVISLNEEPVNLTSTL